jgi:four helix bundle protein
MKRAIDDLEIYREALELGEEVWAIVMRWEHFARDTVGKQLVRAIDSVVANLAECYGRYHFKENQKFCFYSRGSAEESQTWIEKASRRKLIELPSGRELYDRLEKFKKRLNAYIGSIGGAPSSR